MKKLILTLSVFILISTETITSGFTLIDYNKYQICNLQKTENQKNNVKKTKVINNIAKKRNNSKTKNWRHLHYLS